MKKNSMEANRNTSNNSGNKLQLLLNDPQGGVIISMLGWFLVFIMGLFIMDDRSFEAAFISSLSATLILAGISYFNDSWLIPKFFKQGKYVKWVFFFLSSCLLGSILQFGIRDGMLDIRYTSFAKIAIGIITVSFLIFLFKQIFEYYMNYSRWENKATQLDSEVKLLRAQVNPHFLFNSLNSIYSLSLDKDERTPEITMKLSQIMRYMVDRAAEDRIQLNEEISYLRDYLDLEKLRLGNKAEISFEINGQTDYKMVEPLLFIPFVENAMKHGVDTMKSGGFIRVNIDCEPNLIQFKCQNNFNPSIKKLSTGTGINNVRKRLEKLYPGKFDLFISKEDETFKVYLKLYLS
jgi:two-component system LytT family sensor kinase